MFSTTSVHFHFFSICSCKNNTCILFLFDSGIFHFTSKLKNVRFLIWRISVEIHGMWMQTLVLYVPIFLPVGNRHISLYLPYLIIYDLISTWVCCCHIQYYTTVQNQQNSNNSEQNVWNHPILLPVEPTTSFIVLFATTMYTDTATVGRWKQIFSYTVYEFTYELIFLFFFKKERCPALGLSPVSWMR